LGHLQHSLCQLLSATARRPGWRICLSRGCGHVYRSQRWNQRYCQVPECLSLVRRWQAAKRQEERRRSEAWEAHATAEHQWCACCGPESCRECPSDLREHASPLGDLQHALCEPVSTTGRRLGLRVCLRRGCGRTYRARRSNQRYCQEPECLKLVRRWQAAKRQSARRQWAKAREAHATAERRRRARRRAEGCRESSAQREPAPDDDPNRGAWSRSKRGSEIFCDRPGCYDAVRPSCRCRARYCSDDCRQAVKRVRDRERKWLARQT